MSAMTSKVDLIGWTDGVDVRCGRRERSGWTQDFSLSYNHFLGGWGEACSGCGFGELKSQVPVRDPMRRSSRCLGRWSQSAGDGDINLGVTCHVALKGLVKLMSPNG